MTPTQISNLALDAVPAGRIVSLTEASLSAKTCSMHYAQVLGEILEMGPWRFSIRREALAELPANDREGQWLYAYAMPTGMAFPIQVMDSLGSCSVGYEFSGVLLYSNEPDATVEYVTTADMAGAHTALFRAALIARLAARICLPITKDLKRAQFLANAAEVAGERAQAANHNQRNNTYGNHVPDILRERMGLTFDDRRLPGPEAVYPDFDPVQTFEDSLD
jgi:hypothetical protein